MREIELISLVLYVSVNQSTDVYCSFQCFQSSHTGIQVAKPLNRPLAQRNNSQQVSLQFESLQRENWLKQTIN